MVDNARAQRLAKRIATIVATALEHETKDPRLEFVTVTDCKVTGDLREATIYYTVRGATLETEPDFMASAAGLEKAKGKLRTKVGESTGIRYTPSLAFVLDRIPETSRHMEELLARVRESDAEVARVREGAKPAGEADPYKQSDAES